MSLFAWFEKMHSGSFLAGDILTDFGCGSGEIVRTYLSYGLNVQLVDIAKNCLGDDVIPNVENIFIFKLRENIRQIDDRKRHSIKSIQCRLRSSICRMFSRSLNMKIFSTFGIKTLMQFFQDRCVFFETTLWELPRELKMCKWLMCTDVLEHIPPEKMEAVLDNLAGCHQGKGLFTIAMYEDGWGKAIKTPLHLSIFNEEKWRSLLAKHWTILTEEIIGKNYIAIVERHTRL